jgi:hypothetical protein
MLLGKGEKLGRRFGFEVLELDHPPGSGRGVFGAFFGNVLYCHVLCLDWKCEGAGRLGEKKSSDDREALGAASNDIASGREFGISAKSVIWQGAG